jgi:oligopeptide/dipeptide ABC transporter ATP-binding protein
MYHGRMVEVASREELFRSPQHPYTRLLLDAVPVIDPGEQRARMRLLGEAAQRDKQDLADVANGASGCRFLSRCAVAAGRPRCAAEEPQLARHSDTLVACHYPGGAS